MLFRLTLPKKKPSSPKAHTNPALSFRRDGLLLPWYNSRHGAMLHAVAAVEAVLLVDDAGAPKVMARWGQAFTQAPQLMQSSVMV